MSWVVHAPFDALTTFDPTVQTFRINMELSTHYHKHPRKKFSIRKVTFGNFFKKHFFELSRLTWVSKSLLGHFWSSKYQKIIEKPRTDDSYEGYIDVGDKRMLATLSWWQFLDVSDRISILVTSFGCWCPTLMLEDVRDKNGQNRYQYLKVVANIFCHQHPSPTSPGFL